MMFMLRKTHDAAIALRDSKHESDLKKERTIHQRALDAERSITASLRAEIAAMRDDYERGKAHREKAEAYNAERRNNRKVAK